MGNMETLESGTLYIKNDDGSMAPLGKFCDVELELSSPSDGGVYEHEKTIKKISETSFEITGVITSLGWHLRKYSINNWRKNHGLPMIRRRRKYAK